MPKQTSSPTSKAFFSLFNASPTNKDKDDESVTFLKNDSSSSKQESPTKGLSSLWQAFKVALNEDRENVATQQAKNLRQAPEDSKRQFECN